MRRKAEAFLFDILGACDDILSFIGSMDADSYAENSLAALGGRAEVRNHRLSNPVNSPARPRSRATNLRLAGSHCVPQHPDTRLRDYQPRHRLECDRRYPPHPARKRRRAPPRAFAARIVLISPLSSCPRRWRGHALPFLPRCPCNRASARCRARRRSRTSRSWVGGVPAF